MAENKSIIIKKVKKAAHGGSWKVAYADFVTAMMCFFMVMWLVNAASAPTKENIASYFRRPGLFQQGSGRPLMTGSAGILPDAPPPKPDERKRSQGDTMERLPKKTGTEEKEGDQRANIRGEKDKGQGAQQGMGEKQPTQKEDFAEENYTSYGVTKQAGELRAVATEIKKAVADSKELRELLGIVDVKVDADGLNIEIMDTEKASMFSLGSARILPEAEAAFKKIGALLAKLPNGIDIVGHTDARPFPGKFNGYSNWELSSDRANAARRLLVGQGVAPQRMTSVVGRADQELKKPDAPLDPSNRRITIKMRFRLSTQVDLAKDPSAIDTISFAEQDYQAKQADKVHALSAKEINEAPLALPTPQPSVTISLPDGEPPKANPDFFERDTIFNDNPLIKPDDHFARY